MRKVLHVLSLFSAASATEARDSHLPFYNSFDLWVGNELKPRSKCWNLSSHN